MSPSADGANPTADNTVDDNRDTTGSCADSTRGESNVVASVFDTDSDGRCGAASTTDTSSTVTAATGSDLGLISGVLSETGSPFLASVSDGADATDRFGFVGLTAVADVSEPDFLSVTVAA
jgi:hypothetical protein